MTTQVKVVHYGGSHTVKASLMQVADSHAQPVVIREELLHKQEDSCTFYVYRTQFVIVREESVVPL